MTIEIPAYYHLPGNRNKPPVPEIFCFQGREYCRFRAGKASIGYPQSLDILMEDGRVIAEGDSIRGPLETDGGIVLLIQSGPFTHLMLDGKPIARERAGVNEFRDISVTAQYVTYRIGAKRRQQFIGD
jgi:hypothetical protein